MRNRHARSASLKPVSRNRGTQQNQLAQLGKSHAFPGSLPLLNGPLRHYQLSFVRPSSSSFGSLSSLHPRNVVCLSSPSRVHSTSATSHTSSGRTHWIFSKILEGFSTDERGSRRYLQPQRGSRAILSRVNRSILFLAFAFLLLLALLLLLSDRLSRFSIPRAMLESWRTSDRAALEKETFANQQSTTKNDLQPVLSSTLMENRRRLFGVGLFPNPVELKEPASDERAHFFITAGRNQVVGQQGGELSRPGNQVRSTGYRPRGYLVTRIHGPRFFERRLAPSAKGPSWQKIRSNIQKLERRITRSFHPTWRRGRRYAIAPRRNGFAFFFETHR